MGRKIQLKKFVAGFCKDIENIEKKTWSFSYSHYLLMNFRLRILATCWSVDLFLWNCKQIKLMFTMHKTFGCHKFLAAKKRKKPELPENAIFLKGRFYFIAFFCAHMVCLVPQGRVNDKATKIIPNFLPKKFNSIRWSFGWIFWKKNPKNLLFWDFHHHWRFVDTLVGLSHSINEHRRTIAPHRILGIFR